MMVILIIFQFICIKIMQKKPVSKEVIDHRKVNDYILDKRKRIVIERKNDTLVVDEYLIYKSLYKNDSSLL
ncbi:hypothetical protein AB674_02375 [Flavobacterium sp. ABG]|nr:hypothetical protein AB674_02375 [Flavobacterium sp. ABG]